MVAILISSSADNLQAVAPVATVEAEYGDRVVEGSAVTLAHHGSRAGNPCPCLLANASEAPASIGISHVDLDTVGGIMALLGVKPRAPMFWALAAFVDLNGVHKLAQSGASEADKAKLAAYHAFSQTARVFPPRDGSVLDVTEQVMAHVEAVTKILDGDRDMLTAGEAFTAAGEALNAASFVKFLAGGVILRSSESFANHLYVTPGGEIARAVVTHNPSEDLPGGAITASLADPVEGLHIGNLLAESFGEGAGGHAGIGGSQRGEPKTAEQAADFARLLAGKLSPERPCNCG